MKRFTFAIAASAVILSASLAFFSCTKDKAYPQMGGFPVDVGTIFSYKCSTAGCHNALSFGAASGLNLISWSALFQGANSGSPVIPFRSDFSSMCYYVNTNPALGITNKPTMPLNGTPLSETEVKTIRDWINAGAPDINGKIMWADDPQRPKFYVANQGCDVVTVFDARSNLPMRYITVGNKPNIAESPHKIAISPDGKYWYVLFVGNNILQKYSTADNTLLAELALGPDQNWNTMTISPDGTKGYCISWQNNSKLASVDLVQMKVIQYMGGFATPVHGSCLNKTNDTLYVTSQTGNFIYKLDTGLTSINQIVMQPGQPINTSSSLDPHEIMLSPDGTKYFVTCQASNEVRVMSVATNQLIRAIPCGVFPQEIAMSPLKNKIFVTCMEDSVTFGSGRGVLSMIDMTSYQISNYKVGYMPHGVGVNEALGYIYVSSRNIFTNGPTPHHTSVCGGRNGFVNYFNLSTMQLLTKKTEISSDPYGLAVKP